MRILMYNFVQPDEHGAGGAGLYHTSLARTLAGRGHEIVSVSSGAEYRLWPTRPYLEYAQDPYRSARIINSPVVAPARFAFTAPDAYHKSSALDFAPRQLLQAFGPVDVLHFQSTEGLTASALYRFRETFPNAKMIYTAHNYGLVCPVVSLWYDDRLVCEDYREGAQCTSCQRTLYTAFGVRWGRRLRIPGASIPTLKRQGKLGASARPFLGFGRRTEAVPPGRHHRNAAVPQEVNASSYAAYRYANIGACRDVFDHVLAVSNRTKQVLAARGVPAEKIGVTYIGTGNKERFLRSEKRTNPRGELHLAYLGYMSREKGFRFLLECLENLATELASRITLTVAAENTSPADHARMLALSPRLRGIRYFDGYAVEGMAEILEGVNLGIVPVLWEDNLPQVAIELVSHGVPIITSERGGAQEIFSNRKFVFQEGVNGDLAALLTKIITKEVCTTGFWESEFNLRSMDEHVDELSRYYGPGL